MQAIPKLNYKQGFFSITLNFRQMPIQQMTIIYSSQENIIIMIYKKLYGGLIW